MTNESTAACPSRESLRASGVYMAAGICLAAGLAMGYVVRGPATAAAPATAESAVKNGPAVAAVKPQGHVPSLEEMKQMADKQAAPLVEKLKANPKDSTLLAEVGTIYHTTHQFKEAAQYYGKAVAIDPKNVAIRSKLASSLYRAGDVDGAIGQLNEALRYDPKDANSLFNLGMIRLQGKGDGEGALAAWQKLLKANPQLSADRKAEVQKLMADVLTTMGDAQATKGAHRP